MCVDSYLNRLLSATKTGRAEACDPDLRIMSAFGSGIAGSHRHVTALTIPRTAEDGRNGQHAVFELEVVARKCVQVTAAELLRARAISLDSVLPSKLSCL